MIKHENDNTITHAAGNGCPSIIAIGIEFWRRIGGSRKKGSCMLLYFIIVIYKLTESLSWFSSQWWLNVTKGVREGWRSGLILTIINQKVISFSIL